jgi:hypothetical protein
MWLTELEAFDEEYAKYKASREKLQTVDPNAIGSSSSTTKKKTKKVANKA